MNAQDRRGPLDGVKVVELATVLMGPFACQILGDMGADVTKVEGGRIDPVRVLGGGPHPEISGVALNALRNRRSVRMNLSTDRGRGLLLKLLDTADVLVTNFRPSALTRMGVDYSAIRDRFPNLIYCEAHGFRSDSGDAERPAFDDIIQSETGMPRMMEWIEQPPTFLPAVLADKITGLYITIAVLGALAHRGQTGRGQRVEVPMFDSLLAFNLEEHLAQAAVPGGAVGYSRILTRHRGPHRTADGHIAMIPYSDQNWRDVFTEAGVPAQFDDPRFTTLAARHADTDTTYGRLAELIADRTTAEWTEFCLRADVPVGQVPSIQQIVDSPALHRGVLEDAVHPSLGAYRQIRPPIVYDQTPMSVRRPAPFVGQHTVEILHELGISDDDIATLLQDRVARQSTETLHPEKGSRDG